MEHAINEALDYMGKRVALATACGGTLGGCLAIYRGHAIPMIASSMAKSWALTATACVVSQQLALAVGRSVWPLPADNNNNNKAMILASHGVGGIFGGSVLGYLYIRKPLRGVVFMTPVMLLVGLAEAQYQEKQRQKLDPDWVESGPVRPTRNTDGSLASHVTSPKEQSEQ